MMNAQFKKGALEHMCTCINIRKKTNTDMSFLKTFPGTWRLLKAPYILFSED